jgi:hypothetical protein
MANLCEIYGKDNDPDLPDLGDEWPVSQWEVFMGVKFDRERILERVHSVTNLSLTQSSAGLDEWVTNLRQGRNPIGEEASIACYPTDLLPETEIFLREDWAIKRPSEQPSVRVAGAAPRIVHGWHMSENPLRPIHGLFGLRPKPNSIIEVCGCRPSDQKYNPPTQHTINVFGNELIARIGETEVIAAIPDSLAPLILLRLKEDAARRIVEMVGNVGEAKIILRFLALLYYKFGSEIPEQLLHGDKTALLANDIPPPKKFERGERKRFFEALRIAYEAGWQPQK